MTYDSQGSAASGEGSDSTPRAYPPAVEPPPGYVPAAYPPPSSFGGYPQPPLPPPPSGGYESPPQGAFPPMPPPGFGVPGGYGGYPPGYGYPPPRRTDGTAIAALVLAIASFVVCPLVPSVVALSLIPSSRRTIAASGGAVDGLGILTAARIIAWINIGLCAVVLILIAIGIAVSSSSTTVPNAPAAVLFG